jgi:hypothetical protein
MHHVVWHSAAPALLKTRNALTGRVQRLQCPILCAPHQAWVYSVLALALGCVVRPPHTRWHSCLSGGLNAHGRIVGVLSTEWLHACPGAACTHTGVMLAVLWYKYQARGCVPVFLPAAS